VAFGPQVSGKTYGFVRTLKILVVNIFLEFGLANYFVGRFVKVYVDKVPRDNIEFGINRRVSMLYEFIIVAVKNIFALTLYKVPNGGANPEEVGNYKERIEVLLDEPLVQVATFYFLYVKTL